MFHFIALGFPQCSSSSIRSIIFLILQLLFSLLATTSTVSFPTLVLLLKVAGFVCGAEVGCSWGAE